MKKFHKKLLALLDETKANKVIDLFSEYLAEKRSHYAQAPFRLTYPDVAMDELIEDLSDCVEETKEKST